MGYSSLPCHCLRGHGFHGKLPPGEKSMTLLRRHPLFQTLFELKGNPRVTVWTEVMFGVPYNLFAPFMSVYMLALGVTDQQIGALASLGLFVQIFAALLS